MRSLEFNQEGLRDPHALQPLNCLQAGFPRKGLRQPIRFWAARAGYGVGVNHGSMRRPEMTPRGMRIRYSLRPGAHGCGPSTRARSSLS